MERRDTNRLQRLGALLALSAAAALLLALGLAPALAGCGGEPDTTCMPPSGGLKGGYEVRINGKGFERGVRVEFNGKVAKDVKFIGDDAIAVQAPAADTPGAVDIVVTSPKGTRMVFKDAFTYTAMPGLDVDPGAARTAGAGSASAAPPGSAK